MLKCSHCLHIFLIFLFHIWISLSQEQQESDEKNCIEGECMKLARCPKYRDFSKVKLSEIQYCSKPESIVCCKNKKKVSPSTPPPIDMMLLSEKACLEYSKKAPEKCGITLITNGKKSVPKEFPHMALIGYRAIDGTISWFCGGTLISPKFVLTAEHCLSDENANYVRLGEIDWNSTTDRTETQDFSILDNPIYYPTGTDETRYHDIALIELNGTAIFNEYVLPACLSPTNGAEFNEFYAAGWGSNSTTSDMLTHLMKVKLEYFTDEECKKIVPTYVDEGLPDGVKSRTQMCAGSRTATSDTCHGDSGGPLFVNHPYFNCMFMIVGITSFGNAICGTNNSPAVYTRVNLYSEWIETVVWKNKLIL